MLIKKINNINDDFIENIRDLFNTNVDNKINNVDKKLIIPMLKKKLIILMMMIL